MIDIYPILWHGIRHIDPEVMHRQTIRLLSANVVPSLGKVFRDSTLRTRLFGIEFSNPLGLAAGFDKNAKAVTALLALGFGFVEIGTVTPRPQGGNPYPRLFRLEKDRAIINRMGFNNDGMAIVAQRLAALRREKELGLIGGNIGPNRHSIDPTEDCVEAAAVLAPYVDYLVINVSSPNTLGLRKLQRHDPLHELIERVLGRLARLERRPPLLVKVAPDLGHKDLMDIATVALNVKLDGLIATNTTAERPEKLRSWYQTEEGGLSGPPLFDGSTKVLSRLYQLTEGRIPLIGVGGIASGNDAYKKIRAGASLIQLYTGMIYQGPRIVPLVLEQLSSLLRRDGFKSIQSAVGADHKAANNGREPESIAKA